ncbi:FadR family transcriptional regulator [Aquimarina sp. AD10]|uniref:GntR family transcriptional regulator n=1 Tax=Aquimarina aggregata TaxID=1642818 RepID=A0A163BRA5_9FLAO|nr:MULTISPECIES: FadR/GntR family transcriptional regulator [Aquimarina]AXT58888.1 FadR family transcriptional regulator [Aquimarina sp. AD10]KZS41667.1 GntR family transcriptional regulator [Aquimarina aggregata]RKM99636.1 FadR family transcriptional regulator [Aquimarina sp. AD10]
MKLNVIDNTEKPTKSKTSPEEVIISKIRELIVSKQLEPGDRLPAERDLAKRFGVSRNQLRQAIQRLEFYGLVKKYPQSGTRVSNIGVTALNGMMSDILQLQNPDFKSLVETRIILETNAVRIAATRRTENQIYQIQKAHEAYSEKAVKGLDAIEEDLMFHLKLAEASNNTVINSLMLIITPEIITHFVKNKVCNKEENYLLIKEHQDIVDAVKEKDVEKAVANLNNHFKELHRYCNE